MVDCSPTPKLLGIRPFGQLLTSSQLHLPSTSIIASPCTPRSKITGKRGAAEDRALLSWRFKEIPRMRLNSDTRQSVVSPTSRKGRKGECVWECVVYILATQAMFRGGMGGFGDTYVQCMNW